MWRYGAWLKREARQGRFHYLPLPTVVGKLKDIGFVDIEHRMTFAGQAYLIRCRKPLGKIVVRERTRPAERNGQSRFAAMGARRENGRLATSAS